MFKEEARSYFQSLREKITTEEIDLLSKKIHSNLISNIDTKQKRISIFLPIQEKKEINTFQLLEKFKNTKTTFAAPVSNFKKKSLKHIIIDFTPEQIKKNKFNIPEPTYGEEILSSEFDIVLIPLITFDKKGNRVGYGMGFYDRFLAKCKKECLFIGLSIFEQIDQIDDVNSYDIPLNYVITPDKVYKF